MYDSAKAILFDVDGRILVLRRSNTHPHYAHHIDFPGGLIEAGELADSAISREIAEETGLIVPTSALKFITSKKNEHGTNHMIYTANLELSAPEVIISWEHESYQWLTTEEFMAETLPVNADIYHHIVLNHLSNKK